MGREEAITPSPIAINYIYHCSDYRVMGGAPTSYQRFHYQVIDTAGKEHAETCTPNNE
jgi:hypothetical protein